MAFAIVYSTAFIVAMMATVCIGIVGAVNNQTKKESSGARALIGIGLAGIVFGGIALVVALLYK